MSQLQLKTEDCIPTSAHKKYLCHSSDSKQRIYSPSLQVTYRVRRNLQLEAEVVGDWEKTEPSGQDSERTRNFFFLVGYRYDF